MEQFPTSIIDLQIGQYGCTSGDNCNKYKNNLLNRLVGRYISLDQPFEGQLASAIIDLKDFNYEDYEAKVKAFKSGKNRGEFLRRSRKADQAGYYSKMFEWKNFLPDVVEINHSKEVRSGGEMRGSYLKTLDEMGGAPTKFIPLREPKCRVHNTYCWGIFKEDPGYKQGEIETNEKLLGYIKFKRNGNFATYTQILGHGDYLRDGIMNRLHLAVMEWVGSNLKSTLEGLEYVMYGPLISGGPGLQEWKKRSLFEGTYFVLKDEK